MLLNRNFMVFMLLLVMALLTGCGQTTKPLVVTDVKVEVVAIPDPLMTVYPIPVPPTRDVFIKADDTQRLRMMVQYNIDLLETLGKYKLQTQTLKEYNSEVTGKRTDSLRKDR